MRFRSAVVTSLSTANEKAVLRKAILAKRDALDPAFRIEASLALVDAMVDVQGSMERQFSASAIVAGYHPIRSEIDPRPLMAHLSSLGARLCLPVVVSPTVLEFRELVRGAPLVDGGFGTMGPDEDATVLDPDVLLMPLSVFDSAGGRIGYGAGFYDRAIERQEEKGHPPGRIGLAYAMQQIEAVPIEPHDRQLDAIITETGYHPRVN